MKKELLEKSKKKELFKSDLRTELTVILGCNLDDFGLYTTFGATRLEDLLEIDYQDLIQAEKEGKIKRLGNIKRYVHIIGCTLKGEFEHLGISTEEALIPIDALEISRRAKSALRRVNIDVLGELLSVPAGKLMNISRFGAKSKDELKTYIESLGYSLQNTDISVEERKAQLESSGELLVERVIASRQIMLTLNRSNIYTIDELMKRDFRTISGVGEIYEAEIVASLKDYISQDQQVSEKEDELAKLTQTRDTLRKRNIALILEQREVTEQLRQVEENIRNIKVGRQYGKK